MKYKRILLKISGESLMDTTKNCIIDQSFITNLCQDIAEVHQNGIDICLVIGGGNICRGSTFVGMGIERANADYMGMLATIINSLAVQARLESLGIPTRVQSAINMPTIAEPYIRRKAIRHMDKKRVVIFSGGTGNPFFTTDTAAVLRAIEMHCDVLLKGTQVDGVYSSDPVKNPDATMYTTLSHSEALSKGLKVMDTAAIALADDNSLPIIVFNIHQPKGLIQVLNNKCKFSLIK